MPKTSPETCIAKPWRNCCRTGSHGVLPLLAGLLLACCVLLPVHAAEATAVLAGKVSRVIDGDTIDVLLASGRIRVRLQGIDAPERDQAGGAAATTWLTQQLVGRKVMLEPVSQDQYDRMVAVVHVQDRNINSELVRAGHAWAYRRYMRRDDGDWCALEASARRRQLGLWTESDPHAPWEYRATDGKGPFTSYRKSSAEECRKTIGR